MKRKKKADALDLFRFPFCHFGVLAWQSLKGDRLLLVRFIPVIMCSNVPQWVANGIVQKLESLQGDFM